jgi:hypothetical protein
LTIAWHLLATDTVYEDLGADWFTRHDHQRSKQRALNTLQALGYTVTIEPAAAA